jgi:hypothetical protein
VGPATLTFNATAAEGSYGGTGTSVAFSGSSTAGGTVQITYTYEEQVIPEPVTLFTVGSALIGVGLFLQRKRKRA